MRKFVSVLVVSLTVLALLVGTAPVSSSAASHREAPLISMDPTADITDFFMFRSYETGREDNIVLIMDVIPGEEPSAGPNYYNFDPSVLYTINVDNDMDGNADDVRFEFEFKTEIRGIVRQLDLFLSYVALPPITSLKGAGSEGLGLRQTYTVTMVRGNQRKVIARDLVAVPSNVGPRTMPDYEALVQQGIYELDDGARVFAGQRDDPFFIDLGAIFDTLNVRNPGVDMLSGFNVHSIALEVPASWLTADEEGIADTGSPILGAYASTYRRSTSVLRPGSDAQDTDDSTIDDNRQSEGDWVQVQRLANPLVNEVIIGTEDKDRWNSLDPSRERRFLKYYRDPRLVTALEAVFGADAEPLLDLRDVFLTYTPGRYGRLSELLRLDISVPPVPLAEQDPLTVLAGDNAGWPNGRRPMDDVTDVAIRVVGGTNFATAGDNVDANDLPLPDVFPFLSTPWDGLNRIHQNPAGGPPITPTTVSPTPVITQTGTPPTATPFRTFTPTGTVFVPTPTNSGTPAPPTVTFTPTGTRTLIPPPSVTPTRTVSITPSRTSTSTPSQLLPDLAIDMVRIELQFISCLSPGNPLGVRVFFDNIGQAASGSFVVNVNGATQTVSGLPANAGQALFFPGVGNPVSITLDSTGLVTESNETNNTFSGMVAVPTAPPPCTPTP
jgi:hypothetical protein